MSGPFDIRVFSLKRILLAIVVGFLAPVAYLLTLVLIFELTGKRVWKSYEMVIAWPRVLWDLLVDNPRSRSNVASALLFIAVCDTLVYGAITYVILTAVSVLRPSPEILEPPPTPEPFQSDPTTSE